MKIKRVISVVLSLMIMLTVISGSVSFSANAADTVTYSYVIATDEAVNAFEGKIHYPSTALSVNSITFNGQKNDKNGTIFFNNSNVSEPFDFSGGKTMITVVFDVFGEYNPSDIYGELTDFYSIDTVAEGNIAFDYSNVTDGEIASCGHTDIDTPANSYQNIKYTIRYNYKEYPTSETTSTYTKSVWSNLNNAKSIAEIDMPAIQNPYYRHSVESADFTYTGSTTINAVMSNIEKTYTVNYNGTEVGEYAYLATAVIEAGAEKDFLVNGVRVARGSSFSFFVTGDTDVTSEEPQGTIGESASIVHNALYISENDNKAIVKMELLASATSTDFNRMGVAFAATECIPGDIIDAINTVTSGTGTSNKIAVHNSRVDNPNMSGQYQFIYAPYASVSKVSSDKSLCFYSFVVNNDGTVTVSEPVQVNFANVLA